MKRYGDVEIILSEEQRVGLKKCISDISDADIANSKFNTY